MKDKIPETPTVYVHSDEIDSRFLYHKPVDPNADHQNNATPYVAPSTPFIISPIQSPVYAPETPNVKNRREFLRACLAVVAGGAVVAAEKTGILNLFPDELEPLDQVQPTDVGNTLEEQLIDHDLRFQEILLDRGLYPSQEDEVRRQSIEAYKYVTSRLGYKLKSPLVELLYINDPNCSLHGLTYAPERKIHIYTCNGVAIERAIAITAHEYVHQFTFDRYGHPGKSTMLSEGLATYGAGRYWGDHRAMVLDNKAKGMFYPLDNPLPPFIPENYDIYDAHYYEWSTFVEFLLQEYGQEKFDQVYSMDDLLGAGQFQSVYGKPIHELEKEWKEEFGL